MKRRMARGERRRGAQRTGVDRIDGQEGERKMKGKESER